MKTNKFLGLVGTAAALFSVWTIACAQPVVQRSNGNDDDSDEKPSTSTPTSSSAPTQPVTSTATTTATTTTTADAGTTVVTTDPLSCSKLSACAQNIDNTYEKLGYIGASIAGDVDVCAKMLLACQAGGITQFFGNSCDDLTDCCTEMGSNGNSSQANTCRAKANAGDGDACKNQLNTYEAQGLCN